MRVLLAPGYHLLALDIELRVSGSIPSLVTGCF